MGDRMCVLSSSDNNKNLSNFRLYCIGSYNHAPLNYIRSLAITAGMINILTLLYKIMAKVQRGKNRE